MSWAITAGDARTVLAGWPAGSVQTVVTSPPYWNQRDYHVAGQIGLEDTVDAYVGALVEVFRAVRRVLRSDGTLFLNLGDSYTGGGGYYPDAPSNQPDARVRRGMGQSRGSIQKRRFGRQGLGNKQLLGIPWRVAFALQADGWVLRQAIPWVKRNGLSEPVQDRPATNLEYVFLLSKRPRYYFNMAAVQEHLGLDRNWRNGDALIFDIPVTAYKGAHFATFPTALVEPCILAGSRPGDVVADPFTGAGTVGVVALRHGRGFWGAELNSDYVRMAEERIVGDSPLFNRQEGAA